MFGSLFDDERPAGVMSSVHSLKIPSPPNRRLPCGLSGIENQGATCYLNSLLQTLLYTPEFREGLFGIPNSELGSLENRERGGKVRIIPLQLQRLFARLLLVDQQAASTTELTDSFGWSNNEELQQHDVQELNRILFSAIDSSLVGTSGKNLISQLYHGSTISEIVCQICGKISEKEEDFLDLNVIVANFNNLQDSLGATFLQPEIMKGKNQYRCSTCCNLVDAKKSLKIQCLPPILTLSLLRFSYDIAKGERFKESGKCTFPFELDMSPYCNKDKRSEDTIYELFSVLIHSGCSSGGHYHAYIRDVDCLGKWLQPEEESGKDNNDVHHDPVNLIKAILTQNSDHCLPIEFLCGEIKRWTGLSWNQKYKSSNGVITKFLQKHSDVFRYESSSNTAFLKKESLDNFPPSTSNSTENVTDSPKETKKLPNSTPSFSQNWFDFNDSRVCPINTKDIEKQFSGKESAYMLFYRKKSLARPLEAKGNQKYKMPENLIKLVDEENLELQKQREEFETLLNTVNLQVHLGNSYTCSNGVLEAKPNEVTHIDLAIDKRKLLLDLRDSISKMVSDMYPNQDFVLHTAQEIPAGMHLYEELSHSKNLEVLKDLGILEGTKVFVWDGVQLGGEKFAIGIAHEPVLLNITINLSSGETKELSRGFLKTTTIGELKSFVSTMSSLPCEDIRVNRLDLQGEENRLSPFNDNQDKCTLSELNFIDGDNVVFESIKAQEIKRKANDQVKIIIQNCCQDEYHDSMENSHLPVAEVILDLDEKVEYLKVVAMQKLKLKDTQSYVLRKLIKTQTKRAPLHDHLTLREIGLVDVSYVTIEEGESPSPDQITVLFNIGTGMGDLPEFELTLSKRATVIDCLRQMLALTGLNGDAWHLKKTSWCGEPLEQLSLDGATLEDEGVQHGESLRVMEGRIPAKGFLNFSVYLYPTLETIPNPQNVSMNGLHTGIENLLQSFGDSGKGSLHVGEVEISSDCTVADLKNQILTLPMLATTPLPNIRYLRLQLIDNGRPARVLRGLSNSLKKLKIHSQSLAARVLYREEDLMQSEVLLNVCHRIINTKSYTPPLELVWDMNKSPSPKSLKQAIADSFQYPVQRIVIAKQFPEKCQWLVIDDGTITKKGSRKKRWGTSKPNLRNSPYFLKDGDVIGLKDRLNDPEDNDDFMTEEDVNGQELIRIAAENKRIKRQEEKSPSRSGDWMLGGSDRDLPRHAKKCEVGITIHVDDFT